jgi:hypothetical protein
VSTVAELRANRRVTTAFIDAHPIIVALNPVSRSRTASGGEIIGQAPPRDEQTMRLVDQSSAGGNNPGDVRASDGSQRKYSHQLVAAWNAEMAVGDWWTQDGARYEVMEIMPFNGYERRGMVTRFG